MNNNKRKLNASCVEYNQCDTLTVAVSEQDHENWSLIFWLCVNACKKI